MNDSHWDYTRSPTERFRFTPSLAAIAALTVTLPSLAFSEDINLITLNEDISVALIDRLSCDQIFSYVKSRDETDGGETDVHVELLRLNFFLFVSGYADAKDMTASQAMMEISDLCPEGSEKHLHELLQ